MEQRDPFAVGSVEFGLAAGDRLRWAMVDLTGVVETARRRLDLSPIAAVALGRAMAGVVLIHRLAVKTASRLTLDIKGNGPLARILAEVDSEGRIRGLVSNPHVDLPQTEDGQLPIGEAVGSGILRILREVEKDGRRSTYESQVELQSGEIGEDLAFYLLQSEQIRSAVVVGVLAKPTGIAAAGGLILEAMPEASDGMLAVMEARIAEIGSVSRSLETLGLAGLVDHLLGDLSHQQHETRRLEYRCQCSRERVQDNLARLPAEDRGSLREPDGTITVRCYYCGEEYRFLDADVVVQ